MGNDQASTLRKSGGHLVALDSRRERVILVTGGKGGVGKSTVSVNLAVTYARRGAKTLALDGDMGMADLNLLLGLAPAKSVLDILQGTPVEDVLVDAHGIHLLPALNGSFQLANLETATRLRLFTALEILAERFDTLVIDAAAGVSASNVALAGGVTDVVLVVTPEPLSLADAYACIKVLSTRENIERAYVLPNQVRSPSEADEIFARLSALSNRFLGVRLELLPAIPFDLQVRMDAATGVPLVLNSPDCPAGRAFKQVARRLDALAESNGNEHAVHNYLVGQGRGTTEEANR